MDEEDAVMGTIALVSDVGLFTPCERPFNESRQLLSISPNPLLCGQLGRQPGVDFLWVLPLPRSEPMVSPLPYAC